MSTPPIDHSGRVSPSSKSFEPVKHAEGKKVKGIHEAIGKTAKEKLPAQTKPSKAKIQKAAIGVYQPAKKTTKDSFIDFGVSAVAGSVNKYAKDYHSSINKDHLIAMSKQKMLTEVNDPQFVAFFEMAKAVISPVIKDLLNSMQQNADPIVIGYVLPNRGLILDLVEINLARGFVNLACQVRQNQAVIPNYDKIPIGQYPFSFKSKCRKAY